MCCVIVDVFSVWKSKHSNVGKANCRKTIEDCLVFKWVVTWMVVVQPFTRGFLSSPDMSSRAVADCLVYVI